MFQAPDPKSPLFNMVAGIVNAHAALVRAQPAEPVVTRIEFAPGHEDERLTEQDVAAKLRLMKLAGRMLAALKALDNHICNNLSSDYPTGIDINDAPFLEVRAIVALAEGRSLQEQA